MIELTNTFQMRIGQEPRPTNHGNPSMTKFIDAPNMFITTRPTDL